MTNFRVFLGAPSKADLQQSTTTYNWQTVSSTTPTASQSSFSIFPPATLDAASHRISLFYQNIIFEENEEEHIDVGENELGQDTTTVTWPPTAADPEETQYDSIPKDPPSIHTSDSIIHGRSLNETYETQDSQSYNYSDASSIARFPSFHINLHNLTPLSSLLSLKGSRKVDVLLAVLEVEGPDTIRIKKGADAGKEVSLLKMILGDEDGNVSKLTAWREVAESWGGAGLSPGAKRGDVLHLSSYVSISSSPTSVLDLAIENVGVSATATPGTTPSLTASPYLKSTMTICYRTMPYTHEDQRLRPDLRLGRSDVGVRKVGAVVEWFQRMAGLVGAA